MRRSPGFVIKRDAQTDAVPDQRDTGDDVVLYLRRTAVEDVLGAQRRAIPLAVRDVEELDLFELEREVDGVQILLQTGAAVGFVAVLGRNVVEDGADSDARCVGGCGVAELRPGEVGTLLDVEFRHVLDRGGGVGAPAGKRVFVARQAVLRRVENVFGDVGFRGGDAVGDHRHVQA